MDKKIVVLERSTGNVMYGHRIAYAPAPHDDFIRVDLDPEEVEIVDLDFSAWIAYLIVYHEDNPLVTKFYEDMKNDRLNDQEITSVIFNIAESIEQPKLEDLRDVELRWQRARQGGFGWGKSETY